MTRFRSKILLTAATALLTAGLATAALAQPGPGGRRGGHSGFGGPGGFRGLAQLELTDAQRQQVRDVLERSREQMRDVGERLRSAHEAQRNAVETFPVNEGLIRSTSQNLAAAQTEMALLQARIRSEVWTFLTPEQQAKAQELQKQRDQRREERRQRMQQRREQRRPPQQ